MCDKRPLSNFTYSEKSSEHDASNLVLRDAHAQRTHQFRPHEVIALTSARGHAARPMPPRPYNVTEFVLPPEYFLRKLQEWFNNMMSTLGRGIGDFELTNV